MLQSLQLFHNILRFKKNHDNTNLQRQTLSRKLSIQKKILKFPWKVNNGVRFL